MSIFSPVNGTLIFAWNLPLPYLSFYTSVSTPKTVHLLLGLNFRQTPSIGDVKNSVSSDQIKCLLPCATTDSLNPTQYEIMKIHSALFVWKNLINLWLGVNCFSGMDARFWFLQRSKDQQKWFAIAQILISRLKLTWNLPLLALVIVIFHYWMCVLCPFQWESVFVK